MSFEELEIEALIEEIKGYLESRERGDNEELNNLIYSLKSFLEEEKRRLRKIEELTHYLEALCGNERNDSAIQLKESSRKRPGEITKREKYHITILEALYEMGGKGKAEKVLQVLESKMRSILTEYDYQPLESGEIRWIKAAHWARLHLVHQGLLRRDSPRGIWELSEEGYKFIENYLRSEKNER